MSYKYTYICSYGNKASSALYYSSASKSGDPSYPNEPDAGGRVLVAGIVDGRDYLPNNTVEGQLFTCDLSPSDGRRGGSFTVYWMIDPKAKDKKPDDRVGWAVAIQKGLPDPPYTVVPVWRSDERSLGTTNRKRLYYFQNNYNDTRANL